MTILSFSNVCRPRLAKNLQNQTRNGAMEAPGRTLTEVGNFVTAEGSASRLKEGNGR